MTHLQAYRYKLIASYYHFCFITYTDTWYTFWKKNIMFICIFYIAWTDTNSSPYFIISILTYFRHNVHILNFLASLFVIVKCSIGQALLCCRRRFYFHALMQPEQIKYNALSFHLSYFLSILVSFDVWQS